MGILVFLIARHIFSRSTASETETRTCALLAAAFFVVHPVQTEAVTYVSSRSELLSTAFYRICCFELHKERSAENWFSLELDDCSSVFTGSVFEGNRDFLAGHPCGLRLFVFFPIRVSGKF